jgi:mono/diheme cytochrome c family protein
VANRVKVAAAAAAIGFAAIQLVPLSVDTPPVSQGPAWDAPETEALARRACMDCHSHETNVPWYGHVAPVKWVVRHHVEEGREHLNLSQLDRPQRDADEAGEAIREGEMPPAYYTLTHPEARLTDAEKEALAAGLDATLRDVPKKERGGHD